MADKVFKKVNVTCAQLLSANMHHVSSSQQHHAACSDKALTCNGAPAAEEDFLGHWVVWRSAELGNHDGQHQVLGHLLPL